MYELVEPRLRQLVADRLGVEACELTPEVSLLDDLAADSLDLVDMTLELMRRARRADGTGDPLAMWARVLPPGGDTSRTLERAGWLTPYTVETLVEDASRMGRGARLELTVDVGTPDDELTHVQEQFSRLGTRGVQVAVRRDTLPAARGTSPHAA